MIKAHQLLIKVATRTYLNISWSIIAKFTHRKKMRKFSCSQNLLILIKTGIFPCPGTMITPPILIMLRISDKRVPLFDSVLCIFRISSIIADSVSLLAPYIFSLLFFHQRYLFSVTRSFFSWIWKKSGKSVFSKFDLFRIFSNPSTHLLKDLQPFYFWVIEMEFDFYKDDMFHKYTIFHQMIVLDDTILQWAYDIFHV